MVKFQELNIANNPSALLNLCQFHICFKSCASVICFQQGRLMAELQEENSATQNYSALLNLVSVFKTTW